MRDRGVEPPSSDWKPDILAIIRIPQNDSVLPIKLNNNLSQQFIYIRKAIDMSIVLYDKQSLKELNLYFYRLELMEGIEPTTRTLQECRSAIELRQHCLAIK